MQSFKLAVFAYNFPHKKTQDFLTRLFMEGIDVGLVLAADPVDLNIPPSAIRTKINHGALIHPREIAERIGADYHVVQHNGDEAIELVNAFKTDIGVIAGARILKLQMIEAFSTGIINFHPGLLPEVRGLDAMLWAVRGDIPLGVTAHLIDERIDAGSNLKRRCIPVHEDDSIFDLSERVSDLQLDMIRPAILAALRCEGAPVGKLTPYNRKMPAELEIDSLKLLPEYLQRHAREIPR